MARFLLVTSLIFSLLIGPVAPGVAFAEEADGALSESVGSSSTDPGEQIEAETVSPGEQLPTQSPTPVPTPSSTPLATPEPPAPATDSITLAPTEVFGDNLFDAARDLLQNTVDVGTVGSASTAPKTEQTIESLASPSQEVIVTASPSEPIIASESFDTSTPASVSQNPVASPPDTDESSEVATKQITERVIEIINTNDVKVENETVAEAVTGINKLISKKNGKDGTIDTGEVNLYANVLNINNTNLINSEIVEIFENFNDLSSNLLLNSPETDPYDVSRSIARTMCGELTCESVNTFKLSNDNSADIKNDVSLEGISGDNEIKNIEKRALIRSGNVNVVVNILNIVNANLVNSRWTIAAINIFGDFEGDLVMPSEMYFNGYSRLGGAASAPAELETIEKITIEVTNKNDAVIDNNVKLDTDSGTNKINGTGGLGGTDGEATDANITTGQSVGLANVHSMTNTNIHNGKWYLGMVTLFGEWSGGIFSLPDQVALAQTPTGMTFFAANTPQQDEAFARFNALVSGAPQSSTATISLEINNTNEARITNDVDLRLLSGENKISAPEVEQPKIQSGNTNALANILNFANTNLIGTDFYVGLINVFGSWKGNVVFGYPEASVTQTIDKSALSQLPGDRATYRVGYRNDGDGSLGNARVQWDYDASRFSVVGTTAIGYELDETGGRLIVPLGKLMPQANGFFDVTIQPRVMLNGGFLTTMARILGAGPEKNMANNTASLTTAITAGPISGSGNTTQNLNPTPKPSPSPSPTATPTPTPTPIPSASPTPKPSASPTPTPTPKPSTTPTPTPPQVILRNHLMRMYVENNAPKSGVRAGDTVQVTVTLDNDGLEDLKDVTIYDTLRGPDGSILFEETYPVGTFITMEEIVIPYEIEIPAGLPAGIYTSTVYAAGKTKTGQTIITDEPATSTFRLIAPTQSPTPNTKSKISPTPSPSVSVIPILKIRSGTKDKINKIKRPKIPAKPVTKKKSAGIAAIAAAADGDGAGGTGGMSNGAYNFLQLVTILGILVAIYLVRRKRRVQQILSVFLIAGMLAGFLQPVILPAQAAPTCTQPIVIPFPYAVQANTGGAIIHSNARVEGDARSNANINSRASDGLLSRVTGNATAVGVIKITFVNGARTEHVAPATLPAISIQDWEVAAASGGTIAGNVVYPVNSGGHQLGPVKIVGNLILEDNSEVTLNGVVVVTGNIIIKKNANLHLGPQFSTSGTLLIANGMIDIDGNAQVEGVNGGGFLLIVSSQSTAPDAIRIRSNFNGTTVVVYALKGGTFLEDNTKTIALYGSSVEVGENSRVTYVQGLQFASFVCPQVASPTPTPTPSATPTPTASATPTPTPIPSTSVTPTATPTPSSSVSPTPSSTPTPSTTPTPTPTPSSGGGGGGGSTIPTPTLTPTPTPSVSTQGRVDLRVTPQKTVNQPITDGVTMRNTGNVPVEAGIIVVTFPEQLRYISSSVPWIIQNNNTYMFAVPPLDPGNSASISFNLLPITSTPNINTIAEYLVNGKLLDSDIKPQRIGAVAGASTLPATGPLKASYACNYAPAGTTTGAELIIERIGVRAPIIDPFGNTECDFQKALALGVVKYPGAKYLFAHSSDYAWKPGTYKKVFARLPELVPEDMISVGGQSYSVLWTAIVEANDTSVLHLGEADFDSLTLQTSYPVGTASQRFIVYARKLP